VTGQECRFDISNNIGRDYSEIPVCFSSVSEPRDYLEHYSYKYTLEALEIASSESFPAAEAFLDLRKRYAVISERWSAALDEFIKHEGERLTAKERLGVAVLNIYRLAHILTLDIDRPNYEDQTIVDKHNLVFAKIVELAAFVVESSHDLESPLPAKKSYRPSFSLDMGVVGPLFDVATRCRDPFIRRRAVAILRSASRQEGVLNSYLSALVAERVIQIEENAAGGYHQLQQSPQTDSDGDMIMLTRQMQDSMIRSCHDIPDSARLSYAYPAFDLVERRVFLSIGRWGGMHMNIPLPLMDVMLDVDY
jgi:hypothetical protein